MEMESLPQVHVSSEQQPARSYIYADREIQCRLYVTVCKRPDWLLPHLLPQKERSHSGVNGSCQHIPALHAPHLTCHYVTL